MKYASNSSKTEPHPASSYYCRKKVQLSTKTIWEEIRQCQHIYEEECFHVYESIFEFKKIKECKDVFVKECIVENIEKNEMKDIEVCLRRKERDCDQEGPQVCTIESDMGKS